MPRSKETPDFDNNGPQLPSISPDFLLSNARSHKPSPTRIVWEANVRRITHGGTAGLELFINSLNHRAAHAEYERAITNYVKRESEEVNITTAGTDLRNTSRRLKNTPFGHEHKQMNITIKAE